MNRIFKNKRKQSPDPFPRHNSPGIFAGTTAGPANYQAPPNIGLEGGPIRSYQDLEIDRLDLTVAPGEGNSGGPQMMFQDSMDEDQEPPGSVAWTSSAAIGGTESRHNRTSEYFRSLQLGPIFMQISFPFPSDEVAGDTGGRMSESAEAWRGMCGYNCGIGSLLISISCEEGPEGHSAWGCHSWR